MSRDLSGFVGLVISLSCIAVSCRYGGKLARRWFLPELNLFPTPEAAEAAYDSAAANLRTRLWRLALGACALCSLLLFGECYTRALGKLPYFVQGLPWLVLIAVSLVPGPVCASRSTIRSRLRQALLERGIPVCMQCGYDLRGQTVARCPECGEAFDPALLEQAAQAGEEAKPSE